MDWQLAETFYEVVFLSLCFGGVLAALGAVVYVAVKLVLFFQDHKE